MIVLLHSFMASWLQSNEKPTEKITIIVCAGNKVVDQQPFLGTDP